MTSNACISFPAGVAFQPLGVDQDGVMLSVSTGFIYRCNRTATIALSELIAGKSKPEAARAVMEEFDVDAEQAERDIDTLLEDLSNRELLIRAN